MVTTIPTVGRVAGKGRWISTAAAHLLAATAAAMVFGASLSLIGLPATAAVGSEGCALLWAAAALVGGLSALGSFRISWPQRRAQVPAGWRGRFAPEVTSALYGAVLGVGILTSISFASLHVLLLWTFLSGDVRSGAVMFGVFGLARAAPPVLLSPFLADRQSAFKLAEALMPLHDRVRRVTGLGLLALGATVLVHAAR